jgi:translation initiation factor 1 (eIF-1/SUI1)
LGLETAKLDVKSFVTKCSKQFCCGGSYDKDEKIIKFTGDIRDGLSKLVVDMGLVQKESIKIHGF